MCKSVDKQNPELHFANGIKIIVEILFCQHVYSYVLEAYIIVHNVYKNQHV